MRSTPISIVVPAYNEEARIEATLRDTATYLRSTNRRFELTVVDDGSRDGTSAVVQRVGDEFPEVRLIRLAEHRGKGYAVRTGVVNSKMPVLLFMDADNATTIRELERLEEELDAGAHVVVGSRVRNEEGVTVRAKFHRRVIGRAFRMLVGLLSVADVEDTQCGFKLFRGKVAQDLFSRMRLRGFSFDVEVLLMARLGGYTVREKAVNWEHKPGSRVNLVIDSLRMARDLFLIRARAARGVYRTPHLTPIAITTSPTDDARTRERTRARV